MSAEFQQAPDTSTPSGAVIFDEVLERCYVKTAEALSQSGAASDNDIMKALGRVRESQAQSSPADILETLARVRGSDEERLGSEIAKLGGLVASTMSPPPPSIPFASRLIAPSAFYESFDTLHDLGRMLLSPVLYAEDTDSIGLGSINPIAAEVFKDEIYKSVYKRFGIRPFLTVVAMEYESWAFLCRKHFELP